jgi:hypothetical protein
MSAKPDYVVSKLTRPTGGVATGGFVINLTSSTTPMALSQPKDPTLAQYSFFVSRRLEDGRERFRLHMGYFETMLAAEEMLAVVREVYPGAWASEAPGKKLKPNASAPAAAPAPPASSPPRAAAPAPVVAPPAAPPLPKAVAPAPAVAPPAPPAPVAPPVAAVPPAPAEPHPFASTPPPAVLKYEPESEPFVLTDDEPEFKPMNVPVIHPPARPVVSQQAAKPAAAKPAPPVKAATKPAPKPAPGKPVAAKPAAAKPAAPVAAKPAAPVPVAAKPAASAAPVAAKPAAPATPAARPPVMAPKIAAKVSAPALHAAAPAAPVAKPVAAAPPPPEPTVQMPAISATPSLTNVRQVIEELDDLSDTQTIRLLERHSPYRQGSQEASADEAIRVIKPEDAQSMQAIKNEVKRNAPVLFAVQLDWSVTPFDMAKIPPLAIFNAYSLYTTEANREGRTWYGLRLGFFSDAVSAKQVAYYVRSDFKSVSVVPVTTIEKERANDINAARSGIHRAVNVKEGPAPTPLSMTSSNASGVFKLLDDDLPAAIEQDVDGETSPRFEKQVPTPAAAKAAPAVAPPASPGKASKGRKPGAKGVRRDAHAQVDEETLDQTLEILGAHTLEITNDSAENTGVRHLRVKVDKKGSKFASLIDRLSGKK